MFTLKASDMILFSSFMLQPPVVGSTYKSSPDIRGTESITVHGQSSVRMWVNNVFSILSAPLPEMNQVPSAALKYSSLKTMRFRHQQTSLEHMWREELMVV